MWLLVLDTLKTGLKNGIKLADHVSDSLAYLASPEIVAASALSGVISGPGTYKAPAQWSGIEHGYGTGMESTAEAKLSNMVQQLDSLIQRVESVEVASKVSTEILPGFPEKISGEILFCDHDNLNTDGIYPASMTYQDNVSKEAMAHACMQNYDPEFSSIAKPNDILVTGFNFGCVSSDLSPFYDKERTLI
jgi:homoaconitate hydratase